MDEKGKSNRVNEGVISVACEMRKVWRRKEKHRRKRKRRRRKRCLACRLYCVTQGQVMEREC